MTTPVKAVPGSPLESLLDFVVGSTTPPRSEEPLGDEENDNRAPQFLSSAPPRIYDTNNDSSIKEDGSLDSFHTGNLIDDDNDDDNDDDDDCFSSHSAPLRLQDLTEDVANVLQDSSTLPVIEDPTEHMESIECCICWKECEVDAYRCSGTEQHFLCFGCGDRYISKALDRGGFFDTIQFRGGDENSDSRSEACQIPCPVFVDTCDCAGLPFHTIVRILNRNESLSLKYEQAVRRFIEAGSRRVNPGVPLGDAEDPTNNNSSPIDRVHSQVQEALIKGSVMLCPQCKTPGVKDQACMHIVCRSPACGAKWCYPCERYRGDTPECCRANVGCDARDAYLQNQPGWKSLPRQNGESAGDAACMEFHRRKIRYYIRRIKDSTAPSIWASFQRTFPDILTNIPTEARHITWEELSCPEAALPPVFGNTTERDLAWRLPLITPDVRATNGGVPEPPEPTNPCFDMEMDRNAPQGENAGDDRAPEILLPPFSDLFTSGRFGRQWTGLTVLTCLLLVIRWVGVGSTNFKTVAHTLLAIVCYGGFSTLLLYLADYHTIHRNTTLRHFADRQILGRYGEEDFPYLSQLGRWNAHRNTYVRFLVGGITLGSLFVGQSGMRPAGDGFREGLFLGMGTSILTLVLTSWAWLTMLVNMTAKPETPRAASCFKSVVQILFLWTLTLSSGLGFTVSNTQFAPIGKVLIALGVSGLFSEYLHRALAYGIFWDQAYYVARVVRVYFVSVGFSLGVTLLHIGNQHDVSACRGLGITSIIITTIGGSVFAMQLVNGN